MWTKEIFPENPENVAFPESEPFNQKFLDIPEGKSDGMEIPGMKFPKISVYHARLSSFL